MPPLITRIEVVRSIVSDEGLGQDTRFSQPLVNFLAGEKPPANRIAEPVGALRQEELHQLAQGARLPEMGQRAHELAQAA